MNLEELRSVQNAERRQSDLQSLRESFYAEAGEYVASLKEQRARAADRADDPFSDPEVGRLTDEIETAEEVIEAIYERRMGKVLERASLAAADMSVDEDGLTAEERELFRDLVDRIRENKSTVLDTVAGETDDDAGTADRASPDQSRSSPAAGGGSTAEPSEGPSPERSGSGESSGVSAADVMAGDATDPADGSGEDPTTPDSTPDHHAVDPDPSPPGAPSGGADSSGVEDRSSGGGDSGSEVEDGSSGTTDRATIQITEDVGEIYGVDDREYELAADDVVQLPERNATPLVERDAAERLD